MSIMTDDGGGRLVIPTARDAGRLVGGAALALIGGWIFWQLARGISANHASTHAAWSGYVPAILVFGGIASAFLVPGVAMLTYRRLVCVDLGTREVVARARYLGLWRTRTFPLSRFRRVVIARRNRTRRRSRSGVSGQVRSSPIFVVELAPADGKALGVVVEEREPPARDVATRLAAATGLPLQDCTADNDDDEKDDAD